MEMECGGVQSHSIFSKSKHPVSLKFEDVVYTIKTESRMTEASNKEGGGEGMGGAEGSRKILQGVSGVIHPGEMLAMMGPSGSGKTTLLTALGGRLSGHLDGSITYNGRPISNSMMRNIGFVTQDDVLYPHLTVFETLFYTALLRLPNNFTRKEKMAQAETVMEELGLVVCRNSIIGGPLLRGVSGGERKRVSIGQEMLINPSLLFLDEPTSGLDSTTAQRIVSTLSEMSKVGRTVVMTIHQPSSSLFYSFHKLLLLMDGCSVYFGKGGSEAMEYFSGIGYAPLVPMNPADFLLNLANGSPANGTLENQAAVKEALVAAYSLHLNDRLKEELQEVRNLHEEGEPEKFTNQWTTTWWEQFSVLVQRDIKERRHEAFSGLIILQILAVALISGALWWQSGDHLPDQVGFHFFIAGFWAVTPIYQAIFTFPQERMILAKERSSRMYRLSSYIMARMVGDLPMELALPIIFIAITYWMVGLKLQASSFFVSLSAILLTVLVGQGVGLALGALIMDIKSATTLGAVITLTSFLAAGFYVQKLPAFIAWIKYVSPVFHSIKLLLASQYSATDTYQCAPMATCKVADVPTIAFIGFDHEYVAVAVLFAMLFICRLASYIGLMRVGITN